MDILLVMPTRSKWLSISCNILMNGFSNSLSSPSSSSFRTFCSRNNSSQRPQQNDDNDDTNDNNNNTGDRFSINWDKAWSSFKKQGKQRKKTFSSQFSPNKYVSWNPRRSDYPLSEEVDPIKRTEKSNLILWTSPRFTLAGAIVIVSLLLIYTILAPVK